MVLTQVPFGAQSSFVVQSKVVGQLNGGRGQASGQQLLPAGQHLTGVPPQSDAYRQLGEGALSLVSLHAGVPPAPPPAPLVPPLPPVLLPPNPPVPSPPVPPPGCPPELLPPSPPLPPVDCPPELLPPSPPVLPPDCPPELLPPVACAACVAPPDCEQAAPKSERTSRTPGARVIVWRSMAR
jgi:hypothetical protein